MNRTLETLRIINNSIKELDAEWLAGNLPDCQWIERRSTLLSLQQGELTRYLELLDKRKAA